MAAAAALFLLLSPVFAFAQTSGAASPNADVEATVRAYFAAAPVMIEIAKCESRFREFNSSGAPLNGGSGNMIGVYQINARVHKALAASLGMDINTTIGNLEYANYLYQKEGTVPWVSSETCWKPAMSASASDQSSQLAALQVQVAQLSQKLAALEMSNDAVAGGAH